MIAAASPNIANLYTQSTMYQRIAVAIVAAMGLYAQSPAGDPGALRFEVASLKAGRPGGPGGGMRPEPGGPRYLGNNVTLKMLIMVAYRIKSDQVVGGPGWIDTDLFDINAKAERPSTTDELHTMLANLLTDQFQLQLRHEMKELPVYALSVDKGGAKMTPHEAQSAGDPWIDEKFDPFPHEKMKATSATMAFFVWRLGQMLDRPVIDLTSRERMTSTSHSRGNCLRGCPRARS